MSAQPLGRLTCMAADAQSGAAVVRLPPVAGSPGWLDVLQHAARLLAAGRDLLVVLEGSSLPDVATVGELARLVLLARRGGAHLVVQAPDDALQALADLMGLCEVLPLHDPPSSREPQR